MNNTSGIYSLVNKVNGKRYVGQATNIQSRLGQHKSSLKNNNHTNIEMQNDYNLFGSEAFDSPEILEYCTEDKLNQQEIYWIAEYNAFGEGGYNKTAGGIISEKTYNFYNDEFETEFDKTMHYMYNKYTYLKPSHLALVCYGNQNSTHGWRITEKKIKRIVSSKKNIPYNFIHKDGRIELNISQSELMAKYSLDSGRLSDVVNGKQKSTKGWMLITE